jgi:hypothetical protein
MVSIVPRSLLIAILLAGCSSSPSLQWYRTCGWPVCFLDAGFFDAGVSDCTSQEAVGNSCPDAGTTCNPGLGCGVLLECADTDPTHGGNCPISRRSAKQDIEYLTPLEIQQEAKELLAIPLTRYRYLDEPRARAAHLGFIIDDVGPQECVNWPAKTVDLYGYTSMAVAALQAQQAEIQELQKRLSELEAKTTQHESAKAP